MTAAVATANSLQSLLVGIRRRLTPQELGVTVGPRQSAGPGVSQEQVARALGISLRHYSAWRTARSGRAWTRWPPFARCWS
jgi:hypothetical protein